MQKTCETFKRLFESIAIVGAALTILLHANSSDAQSKIQQAPKVAILYSDEFLLHDTGAYHPERPARLTDVESVLRTHSTLSPQLVWPSFKAATVETLNLAHTADYIELVTREVGAVKAGQAQLSTGDTVISSSTQKVAALAVGASVAAVDSVMASKVSAAFALVRPPGHHASAARGMGFCVYNNVAVAARHLQKNHGLKRILIVDFDVHHGNGTQDIFYADDSVFYFSVHQHPFYPGTGRPTETGAGKGRGTTLNVDLPAGAGDSELLAAFEQQLKPAMQQFKPEFILVSAGFDAHEGDMLGQLNYSDAAYGEVAKILRDIAKMYANNRTVYVLEGGYTPENITNSVVEILQVLTKK